MDNEFTPREIATALLLCKDDSGGSCMACPYLKYTGTCSKRLIDDAARIILGTCKEKEKKQ